MDEAWWRERLAGTTHEGLSPDEVEEVRRAQGVARLPAAYEGFLLAAGRGCSHVWEPDMYAYYPDALELREGAEELLAEDGHPFTLGPDDVVITLTGGYELDLLRGLDDDPVAWHFVEGDPGPVDLGVRFSERILGQLPGGRFGWRWDRNGEAGPARWAVHWFLEDWRGLRRWLLEWCTAEVAPVSSIAGFLALVHDGRLPRRGTFVMGAEYLVHGGIGCRLERADGLTVDVDVVGGVETFDAHRVRLFALSCQPSVDVPVEEVEAALLSYVAQGRLEGLGDGRYALPERREA